MCVCVCVWVGVGVCGCVCVRVCVWVGVRALRLLRFTSTHPSPCHPRSATTTTTTTTTCAVHQVGWDFTHPQSRVPAAFRVSASDEAEEEVGGGKGSSLVATKLLEKFSSSVAQRGGVDGLRTAMRYADTNGDGQ
jgi:hypothetical protein